ncbi:MAG: hydrolase [Allomuricauda sp.]|nr:MAG: hydrolase [Allomuricauda sp.]
MARNYLVFLFPLALSFFYVNAQAQQKSFVVKYINEPIALDGTLDENAWQNAESANNFYQYFPTDSVQANQQSDIKMLFDDTNLYVGITVYAAGNDYVVPSLQRDFRAGGSDNITLMFDTFNDGTNAFLFGTNPYGVRREALVSNGGTTLSGFTTSWDVKWRGETKMYDGYYISEWAIPLTSFKFKQGETKWRFNSYRFDVQSNESSTWMQIPQNQFIFNLAFMGDMVFEKPLGKSRTPFTLVPYVNGISLKDFDNNVSENKIKVGGDAKVAIGNGMNLDITVNPDFSNVEVDNLIINTTRFAIALPERRQFFIDNVDLFGTFGNRRDANPFFSRRIGIAQNAEGETIENPIIAGFRLSGKLNENWRLGVLNIQTEADESNEIASNNNTVVALQKKMFSRSNLSFLLINRETFGDYEFLDPTDRYNRVVGVDYNLASSDNTWVGKFYYHKSFASQIGNADDAAGVNLEYFTKNLNLGFRSSYVGNDYRSDLGFIRRKDIIALRPYVEYNFWPEKSKLIRHGFRFGPNAIFRPTLDYQNTDYTIFYSWDAQFQGQEELGVRVFDRYTFLVNPFDPTGTDGAIELPGDLGYHYLSGEVGFQSDRRKQLSYAMEVGYGEFYNGTRSTLEGSATLRLQPKVLLSLNLRYNGINLPDPYPSADIWLVSPRVEITFNKSIFWTTLVQYGNQSDNLGINSRLQWRFAPLSDLFIVYNDNYFVNTFMPRNRSINLKLTYWLNI